MKKKDRTIKQEKFCQAYVRLGDKSAAYREAYSTKNMKPETIHERASKLSREYKISTRIDELQKKAAKRNEIAIDELIQSLAGMVRFDIAELYDENGFLKPIYEIPIDARRMISQLDTYQEYDKNKKPIGQTKRIKIIPKLDAIEKLMKHLGGYEKHNVQKAKHPSQMTDEERDQEIQELIRMYNSKK